MLQFHKIFISVRSVSDDFDLYLRINRILIQKPMLCIYTSPDLWSWSITPTLLTESEKVK